MAQRILNVGMIGYGFMGKTHTACYRDLPMYYDPPPVTIRLAGVATRHRETAEHAVRQAGYLYGTVDWRKIAEDPDVDVVNICSPNEEHREQVLACLAAGKHVYCEKPLAADAEEAREMAHAARAAGVVHQMVQNYRFVPATMRAKQLCHEGFLGRAYSFRGAYLHSGSSDPSRPLGWKMQRGGTLHDLGAHVVDLIRHLWGDFDEITARRTVFVPERRASKDSDEMVTVTGDDAAWMLARLKNGAMGTIETSKVATGAEDELIIELYGDQGAIRFNLMDADWLDVYDMRRADGPFGGDRGFQRIGACSKGEPAGTLPPAKGTAGWMQFHRRSLHSFVSNVANGAVGSPNFFDGWAAHEVFRAAELSSESGQWEKVRQIADMENGGEG